MRRENAGRSGYSWSVIMTAQREGFPGEDEVRKTCALYEFSSIDAGVLGCVRSATVCAPSEARASRSEGETEARRGGEEEGGRGRRLGHGEYERQGDSPL